ncbi:ESX-3 secretion system protein EccA3 [Seminavis robusta]|uniref:ESX-3 secretion system protein EccA3 n=1 Tax=Seminavis robusta TaxID=568900 RepID=A0A9N8EJ38_9STRA|nr:ESX-3 secretion system protein EccA3 [Seminavis robusta]|eukprot:Sro1015_g231580.1 ESX-3 secretion system protein EccA3 (592) ;mRNA; f:34053-35993
MSAKASSPKGGSEIHDLAKGWKAAIARAKDPATRHEARIKNDRGNLPLHSAASFRAPLEVTESLLEAYPEAASMTNNYGNLALHFTAWKKGPLDVEKLLLKIFPEGAAQKNNHGNLPLHYAAHYNAPLEVVEALYHAYPEGATQKNNDNNTPLDLAIADGASPNVVALLQGKNIPPTDDEVLQAAKTRCERAEKELSRILSAQDGMHDDLEVVLSLLMDIREGHPHALYSAGIHPAHIGNLDALLEQVRKAGMEEAAREGDEFASSRNVSDEEVEAQVIEDSLCPPDDPVEAVLANVVGLDTVKHQIRGLRRTLEMQAAAKNGTSSILINKRLAGDPIPKHLAFVGNPGCGKRTLARLLGPMFYDMGMVRNRTFVEISGRDELIDRKSEARTVFKTRQILEQAAGGVLLINEAYTFLPSSARPRGRDHGAAALREIARALPAADPLIILSGTPMDLQRILSSDIGFKTHFLTRVEFPDPSPIQIARIFMHKLTEKGLVPAEGVTIPYLAELIGTNTEAEWRLERNGIIADLLMTGVRSELRKRKMWDDSTSKASMSPMKFLSPGSSRIPAFAPEEVFVTVEDIQNAIVNGL